MTANGAPAPLSAADVARHYDELDAFYREIWGEHVHHGLWLTGKETAEQAVALLVDHVAEAIALIAGETVMDVGAGYGGTARQLASTRGVSVIGLTVSAAQHAHSLRAMDGATDNPRLLLGDWLSNGQPSSSADVVLAIESTEHMVDLPLALAEMRRVLRPGGRVAVCAWLAGDRTSSWQRRLMLEPIRREGRLATLSTAAEYRDALGDAGFEQVVFEDLTSRVRQTWSVCLRRVAGRLLVDPVYRRYAMQARNGERVFLATIPRILVAYATGAMRYGLFVGKAPGGEHVGSTGPATG